jgi:AraC-like DNA-binding protein
MKVELPRLFEELNLHEGLNKTFMDSVRLFKVSNKCERQPLMYEPCLCIIAQGHKVGFMGGQEFRYDAENYLVVTLTTPFECSTFATPENPLYGMFIDIDISILHEIIPHVKGRIKCSGCEKLPKTVGPAVMDDMMKDAVGRLLTALRSEVDSNVLEESLKKEIYYRALSGAQAYTLYALAGYSDSFSNIAQVLQHIHMNYYDKLDVNIMAEQANMSLSSFHRAFKEVTSDPPIQYLKKIRLSKAKDLILNDRLKAYAAAEQVGYESVSQFSREFKRYFGVSASQMIKETIG